MISAEQYEAITGITIGILAHLRMSLHEKKGNTMTETTKTSAATPDYRVMFDSSDIREIPADAAMVGWYPETYGGDPVRFGESTTFVGIDNTGDHPELGVLDVETGAATFADIPGWLNKHFELHGTEGTIYCDESNLSQVEKIVAKNEHGANLWIADWTGIAHVYAGNTGSMRLVATQYQSPRTSPPSPGAYDLSIVSDADWHPAPKETTADAVTVVPEASTTTAPVTSEEASPATLSSGVVVQSVNGQLAFSRVQSADGKTWTVT